jgi:hypothetical protein
MAAKWVQEIKARNASNPLHDSKEPGMIVLCEQCGGKKGKRVAIYAMVNYGTTFSHCYKCGYNPVHPNRRSLNGM